MKILLCTPFNLDKQFVQGGIAIWAHNIVDYYQSLRTDVQLHIVPYDRRTDASIYKSLLKRAWLGYIDYKKPIEETKKKLHSGMYDIMHFCTSASISLIKDIIVLRYAKKRGVKTVVHFHFGRIPEISEEKGWEWILLKKVLYLSDVAIVMDCKSFDTLKRLGFNNVRYLPNPLSQKIIKVVADNYKIIKKVPYKLCFVGHVIPTKGVYELVEACRDIKGIKVNIIGKVSNEVKTKMKQLSENGDWLCFRGEISHDEVIRELLSSSIFALPSYTEGFPNVILESMACGCAIATTSVGAIPEMLAIDSDKTCGIVVPVKNINSLRDAIERLLEEPEYAKLLAINARQRVNEEYAMPKVWKQIVGIWGEVSNSV